MTPTWFHLMPPEASSSAARVDWLLIALGVFCGGILLLVVALAGTWCIKYRAGSSAPRSGRIRNNRAFEATWITILLLCSLGLFGWGGAVYFDIETPPLNCRTIYVVGRQWMWKVQHPEGRREIDELHVPLGEDIRLVITSQDVVHSLFLPAFRLKQDAVPGRYTTIWFRATLTGTFDLECSEYCGADHSVMRGRLIVMEPQDYEAWLGPSGGAPEASMAMQGQGAFRALGCDVCHRPDSSTRAPRLDGIWERPIRLNNGQTVLGDETYIRESILNPNAKISAGYPSPSAMPTFQGKVSEEQLTELVEFIRSIRYGWPAGQAPEEGKERK